MYMMKRSNGFLLLDDEKMISFRDFSNSYWFILNNVKYFFKKCDTLNTCYSELFFSELAKCLLIPTVSYDLAIYSGMYGVISKNFNTNCAKEVYLEEILKKFYNEVIVNNQDDFINEMFLENTHNLDDIWLALDYYYADKDVVKNLMEQIVDSFILQICTGNRDMHYKNLVILEDEEIHLAPNFDYGLCGHVVFEEGVRENYNLQVSPLVFSLKNTPKVTILDFFNLSSSEYKERFIEKVNLMPDGSFIIENIERRIGVSIHSEIKESLLCKYEKIRDWRPQGV